MTFLHTIIFVRIAAPAGGDQDVEWIFAVWIATRTKRNPNSTMFLMFIWIPLHIVFFPSLLGSKIAVPVELGEGGKRKS